jgi:hypothetical protein
MGEKGIDCPGRMENLEAHSSGLGWSLPRKLEMNIFFDYISHVAMSGPRPAPKLQENGFDFPFIRFHSLTNPAEDSACLP